MTPHKMFCFAGRIAALLAFLVSTASAAPRVTWDAFMARLSHGRSCADSDYCSVRVENRSISVITRDGRRLHTRNAVFDGNGVTLRGVAGKLAKATVTRVEISGSGRHFHHTAASGKIALYLTAGALMDPCQPLVLVGGLTLAAPVWGYTAVTIPFTLLGEGIRLFVPAQTWEIDD